MQAPYGASPVLAIFQGTMTTSGGNAVVTPSAQYGCVGSGGTTGVLILTLDTPVTSNTASVQVSQFGAGTPFGMAITYGSGAASNQIAITFASPPPFFNVVVYNCFNVLTDLP
jgi:hypothetical protein